MPNPADSLQTWGPYTIPWLAGTSFVLATLLTWLIGKLSAYWRHPQAPDQPAWEGLSDALAVQIPRTQDEQQALAKSVREAGFYIPGAARRVAALRCVLLVVPLLITAWLTLLLDAQYTLHCILVGVGIAALGSALPSLWIGYCRRVRLAAIARALPDALELLTMCLGSGMHLTRALEHVANRLAHAPELAQELLLLRKQAEVAGFRAALADLALRLPLPQTKFLCNTLQRATELGSGLQPLLEAEASRLREQRKQAALLKANQTPPKLVLPLVFCFAPAAILLLVSPAALELTNFIQPKNGAGILSENERLGATNLFLGQELLAAEMLNNEQAPQP